jgi:hypothetical protein
MPRPEPKPVSTIHTMPAAGKKAFNRRTVPVPRRPRNTCNPATRLARRHNSLLRRNRAPLPNHPSPRSSRRRL